LRIMDNEFAGVVIDDFIDPELCAYIVSLLPSISWQENETYGYWSGRTNSYWNIAKQSQCSSDVELIFSIIASKISKVFTEYLNVYNLHPDTFEVVRWPEGFSQQPHADAFLNNGQPNEFNHRLFGAILYLNNSFDGGITYYPNFDFSITPCAGRLAIHPADVKHLHGVTEIQNGTRYTIASFWTDNPDHSIGINHRSDLSWT
jgi:hypothetical protein